MRLFVTLLLVLSLAAPGSGQEAKPLPINDGPPQNPPHAGPREWDYDLFPKDAIGVFAIRDVSDLKRKAIVFSKQTKSNTAQLIGFGANMATSVFQRSFGLKESFDETGTVAVAILGAHDSPAFILPITNVAAVAQAFNLDEKEVKAGKLLRTKAIDWVARESWLGVKGNHVVLGKQTPVARAIHSAGLSQKFTKENQAIFAQDDLFATFDLVRMNELVEAGEIQRRDVFMVLPDDIIDLVDSAGLQRVSLGLSIESGFDATLLFDFDSEESRQVLTKLLNQTQQSNLRGLPVGKVVAATARSGGPESGEVIRQAANHFSSNAIGFWSIGDYVAPQHVAGLIGILDEGIKRVSLSRAAIYRNEDADQNGAFSLIAILDTDDTDAFMKDIRELVPIVNASLFPDRELDDEIDDAAIDKMVSFLSHDNPRAREFMVAKLRLLGPHALKALGKATKSDDENLRERAKQIIQQIESDLADQRIEFITGRLADQLQPEFGYVVDLETRDGQVVDAIHINLKGADEKTTGQMQAMMGPDWNKMRLSTVGDQVVVMLGSETALFDKTIDNLKSGSAGLEAEEHYANFRKQMPGELMAELHFSAAAVRVWKDKELAEQLEFDQEDEPQGDSVTSLGLSISPQQIQLDVTIPVQEFDAWERFGR
ncbi:MAG: hypothetical protein WBD20_23150 [Pirellulaceae bacterium]